MVKAYADKKMQPILGSARPSGSDEPKELTFDMKRELNENSNSLSSKDLYGMVGIVEVTWLCGSGWVDLILGPLCCVQRV